MMVELRCLLILILLSLLSCNNSSELLNDESKKIPVRSKDRLLLSDKEDFHCDLTLLPQQKKLMYFGSRSDAASAAADVSYDVYRWPKNKDGYVVVPYAIPKSSKYSYDHLRLIRSSMDAIELVSCIRFKPRKFAKDYLQIFSGKFCRSNLGRTGGGQPLSLNWRMCFEKGIIIHELLHALGYIHMHNRPDRDKYVKIMWKNIAPQWFGEFDRVNPSHFNHLGTPYDYQSIMHYGATAFTKNGKTTILTRNGEHIGQRFGLSEGDIRRINNKYNCNVGSSLVNYFPKPKYYSTPKGKSSFANRHPLSSYEVEEEDDDEDEFKDEGEDEDYLFDT